MISNIHLPTLNAALNLASFLFLLAGYAFIKKKNITAHKISMLSAFACSTLFLASYVYYHVHAGSVRYTGLGVGRTIYFFFLITHIILAAAIVPLALTTLLRALKGDFLRHAAIARWTWPIWVYVSITGVIIYWMLYRI